MDQLLTIACSTFSDRIINVMKLYDSLGSSCGKIKFLVIHQVPDDIQLSTVSQSMVVALEDHPDITYIRHNSRGLTKSRNIAIKNTQSQYMWITDDDLIFVPGSVQKVLDCLVEDNNWCHTFESLKPSGKKRASYPRNLSRLQGKHILRVASFEMVIDARRLRNKNIFFREDMGIGGNEINLGEESVLIADILRAGGGIIHHSASVNIHPDISTGNIASKKNFFSKGVVIKRVFGKYESVYYYLRDVYRILRNRSGEFGKISYRISLIKSLSKGLFYS